MTWKVTDPDDNSRWLEYTGDNDTATPDMWDADPETRWRLTQDGYTFPLTPTGPFVQIVDDSTLMAAAMNLLPGAKITGDPPPYPLFPSEPGRIY